MARIFSGIQPTGIPHLGNYFGALVQWRHLTETCNNSKTDKPMYCIVDIHAYSSPQTRFGTSLYEQILSTTASLLAIGLSPDKCTLFRQSDILEHTFLSSVLNNFVSTQRLSRMTQYKEKSAKTKRSINSLLQYPVLQAADILLYKSSLVPVGEDQLQHIELTRDIAKNFNHVTGIDLFPIPKPLLTSPIHAIRIKSLRDPSRKMSKSDMDKKSTIEITDEPEIIREKIKKAITDSISRVYYHALERPGISNLMRIHHLTTGKSFEDIEGDAIRLESSEYKMLLADELIKHLKPVREEYKRLRTEHGYLEQVLREGQIRARPIAEETVRQVRELLGSVAAESSI